MPARLQCLVRLCATLLRRLLLGFSRAPSVSLYADASPLVLHSSSDVAQSGSRTTAASSEWSQSGCDAMNLRKLVARDLNTSALTYIGAPNFSAR